MKKLKIDELLELQKQLANCLKAIFDSANMGVQYDVKEMQEIKDEINTLIEELREIEVSHNILNLKPSITDTLMDKSLFKVK